MRDANRQGLMQSAEVGVGPGGKIDGAICNCCPDCCYPHLAATALGLEKRWPPEPLRRAGRQRCLRGVRQMCRTVPVWGAIDCQGKCLNGRFMGGYR